MNAFVCSRKHTFIHKTTAFVLKTAIQPGLIVGRLFRIHWSHSMLCNGWILFWLSADIEICPENGKIKGAIHRISHPFTFGRCPDIQTTIPHPDISWSLLVTRATGCMQYGIQMTINITMTSYDHDGVSNHQPHGCFTQPFIQTQIKENIKAPRHWPLCGEFTGAGEFPEQRASYAENVSIWWRHHEVRYAYQASRYWQ